ncbi:dolichyl-phosphate beta-glucosyltransferase [Methanorbis rubei]|uniref:Undecaprenyl-phosphate 4-deoxy-4-formamido-L-arabinose transferase n=1 Tax=Methanorbis rubei TaxID=3028300 RepID=A0AAE4MEZ4_9EURY|nr:Undecaprenyl-phosphate 4-deoxy-4-formamido-L-arabinose transferase [Methanocorpusculaceae archaeon Cs1]
MNTIQVTVVLPVYNDVEALKVAIPRSLEVLTEFGRTFELIVAEDGSTDGSRECVEEWEKKDSRVRLLHSDERQGRGKALNRALAESRGEIFCYYDVDLATDINHLPELITRIENGADVATGSRLMPESNIIRSGDREVASRSYNMLVRLFLGSKLHDHQCGFKAYRSDVLKELVPKIRASHWFWDTESLVLAQHAGLRVDEFPVVWTQGPGTTVRFKDVYGMGSDILKMWWRLHVEKN